ncbi:MAG: hypothetical protein JSR17_09610 [Proteobacteria bacterium]|nr:hypothetical protein [Pseudomonadota bacterium]
MNNMINNLFKLVKSGYYCKKNIKKCLKKDKSSQVYIMAKYYNDLVKNIEKNSVLTLAQIDTIMNQLNTHRVQHQATEEVQDLLSNIHSFFETVQPFIKENLS